MGREPKTAQSSLRFSMGWGTTDEGVNHILDRLPGVFENVSEVFPADYNFKI